MARCPRPVASGSCARRVNERTYRNICSDGLVSHNGFWRLLIRKIMKCVFAPDLRNLVMTSIDLKARKSLAESRTVTAFDPSEQRPVQSCVHVAPPSGSGLTDEFNALLRGRLR